MPFCKRDVCPPLFWIPIPCPAATSFYKPVHYITLLIHHLQPTAGGISKKLYNRPQTGTTNIQVVSNAWPTFPQQNKEKCPYHYMCAKRLRWSRGSVLAFGTQVRGFKPDRRRRIFKGEKIHSKPSFGREVKPSVPCRTFTACKRSLNVTWKSGIFRKNSSAQVVPPFTTRVSGGDTWRCKQERLKTRVYTISLRLQCIRGH